MEFGMILLLAVGLSMDAFAVSMANGMRINIPLLKSAMASGLAFGIFQGLMPLAGYYAGMTFSSVVERYDHWLALFLLGVIGARMVVGAVKEMKNPEIAAERTFSFKELILQAVATSIDAMAVGVGLGVIKTGIFAAVCTIAAVTFVFSVAGVLIGRVFGGLFKGKAEILGGLILIAIGIKIFVEHISAGNIGF